MGTSEGTHPFLSPGLRQIKTYLGKFTDDPEEYLEVFLSLTQSFELTWRHIMLLLNQTLTGEEKDRVINSTQE